MGRRLTARRILGKTDDAIKAFERAVQNGDSEGLAMCQLSELYIETGRVMDGMRMLECNVELVMQVTRSRSARWCRALLRSAAESGAALPPEPAVHVAPRYAVIARPRASLPAAICLTARRRYGKDCMWPKVETLCEKVAMMPPSASRARRYPRP